VKIVSFSLEQGNKYFGRIDGERFFIGRRVPYQGGKGLMNVSATAAQKYNREEFHNTYGLWADFIHPTAMAEGALYHTLNTYDRARFTFSFLQFAAHVPNGDFIRYFRSLLRLPLAKEHFPDLRLENGRIARLTNGGLVALESDQTTNGLLDYLNPTLNQIEDTEVIQAAKFIHWVQNDPDHRRTQIDIGIALFKANMVEYADRYGLDGRPDTICLLVSDIRHQGRAKSPAIVAALQNPDPVRALLGLGEPQYHERLVVIRREIEKLVAQGALGGRKYSVADRDFIPV
jgi:hypothetical protein